MIPIALIAFNRPDTTRRVLEALSRQSIHIPRLIAFCDAPRHEGEIERVEQVRALIREITWTEVEVIEREKNYGLVQNILGGLDTIFSRYKQAVIVEDDILPTSHFYETMCYLLKVYEKSNNIFSVGAYPAILAKSLPNYPYDVVISPRLSVWGWASWADRWQEMSPLVRNFVSPYPTPEEMPLDMGSDMPGMLKITLENPDYTWDVPTAVVCFSRQYSHAVTRHYMTKNLGLESGVHGKKMSNRLACFFVQNNRLHDAVPQRLPPLVRDERVTRALQTYIIEHSRAAKSPSYRIYIGRFVSRLGRLFNRHIS